MKIAVVGKGGVGKTSLAGVLARILAKQGKQVLAIDADPDANFAAALGIPPERMETIVPISQMKELAEERTGSMGMQGGILSLTPHVSDIPAKFAVDHEGVRLLVMGTIERGGGGCVCPEHALVKTLIKHILIQREEAVIMDMEAGIEHLGRGTATYVDALVIVVEPGQRSLYTARQIERLAHDIAIPRIFVVGNKIRTQEDADFITANATMPCLGLIPYDESFRQADLNGCSPYESNGPAIDCIRKILAELVEKISV